MRFILWEKHGASDGVAPYDHGQPYAGFCDGFARMD